MRLTAVTDEISMDFEHALDVLKEFGCEGAEIRSLWNTNIADLTPEQIDDARRLVDRKGLEVCCISSPLFKCELGSTGGGKERTADQQMDLLKHVTQTARLFGTNKIRAFSYWKHGDLTEEIEDRIAQGMADAVRFAEDNDILLLLENEHACYLGTGLETARFLERIGSPSFRAIWDPGNAYFADELPFPDGYRSIRKHVSHVHVKDALTRADGTKKFVVVGDGEIDYAQQMAALRADGYDGWISLETHYAPFAGTPEQGSRLCFQGLRKFMSLPVVPTNAGFTTV